MSEYEILLVEDDEVDIITVKRAFKKANIANPLHVAQNGEEALEFLKSRKILSHMIILLDINMPKMNGIEFLKIIKEDEKLKPIPVVMLTSSKQDRDIVDAYKNSVAGYLVKPVSMEDFIETVAILGKYWSICEIDGVS